MEGAWEFRQMDVSLPWLYHHPPEHEFTRR